jgi:hypothetical protein
MKTIEEAAKKYCNCNDIRNCNNCGIPQNECWSKIKYDAFKAGVEFAQQWISVDDELPVHRQRVLMKTKRFEYAAAGVYDYATFRDHDNNIVYDVECWRPIELK